MLDRFRRHHLCLTEVFYSPPSQLRIRACILKNRAFALLTACRFVIAGVRKKQTLSFRQPLHTRKQAGGGLLPCSRLDNCSICEVHGYFTCRGYVTWIYRNLYNSVHQVIRVLCFPAGIIGFPIVLCWQHREIWPQVYCLLQKFIPRGGSEGMWRKCHELADAHLYLNCDYQIIACFPSVKLSLKNRK